jgi:hypothetical protein
MPRVLIRGEGIAGTCCLHLFRLAGLDVGVDAASRPKLPAVMLGESTQKLLCDVFGGEDFFGGFHRIRRRVVLWGLETEPQTLPHSAVVASEDELLKRVQERMRSESFGTDSPEWTIFATNGLPSSAVEHHFGSRPAGASRVILQKACDSEACFIESVDTGWLFLLPGDGGTGWLLSVGDAVESLLAASRLINRQIREAVPSRGTFPSHPRLAFPLGGRGWLACGSAAVGFDPLCGEGAGNAVREAILASALIRAALQGEEADNLVAHYQARLIAGFQRHLLLCREFYRSGRSGPWWDRQLNELSEGLSWCSQQLVRKQVARYRLNGFSLERAG